MSLAIVVAIVATALGALLGVQKHVASRAGAVQTFAVVASLVVVLGELLPEALGEIGLWALVAFGSGIAIPALIDRIGGHDRGERLGRDLGLEASYLGLLVHKLGDGLGLATFAGPLHAGHDHAHVLVAIGAHSVPMTALIVLVFRNRDGLALALVRAAGIAAAMLIGIFIPWYAGFGAFEAVSPYVTAATAGLLLHVLGHFWGAEGRPTAKSRWVDFSALALSSAFLFLGGHAHVGTQGEDIGARAANALFDLTLDTAPTLLFGLALAALLQSVGARWPTEWTRGGRRWTQAVRGAIFGAPLPVCSCGVLPLAHTFRSRGAGPAFVFAFLIATPELGIDSFALTVRFLGLPFALVRLGAAVLVAIVASVIFAGSLAKRPPADAHACTSCSTDRAQTAPFHRRALRSFDELVFHTLPWTLVGLLFAAYVQASVPREGLVAVGESGLDVLLVSVLAVPTYVCAASATPLAAVLLEKGLSSGAVLAALLLGPATNVATFGWLRRAYGGRATILGLSALILTSWAIAFALNFAGFRVEPLTTGSDAHGHGVIAHAAAVLLGIAALASIYRYGLRAFLGSIAFGSAADHSHHDHDHDHDHGSHDPHGPGSLPHDHLPGSLSARASDAH